MQYLYYFFISSSVSKIELVLPRKGNWFFEYMNHRTSSNSSCLAKTNRGNPEWTYFNQKINWWILLLFCFMLYDFCCVIKLDDPLRHSKAYPIYRSVPVSRGYRVEFPREQTFKSFRGARLSA